LLRLCRRTEYCLPKDVDLGLRRDLRIVFQMTTQLLGVFVALTASGAIHLFISARARCITPTGEVGTISPLESGPAGFCGLGIMCFFR
jgi:hypothetical protein